jgi:hypothetical protein
MRSLVFVEVESRGIFRALRGYGESNPRPPSHVSSSTTTPHSHLCLDMILVPQILYQTEHKLIV